MLGSPRLGLSLPSWGPVSLKALVGRSVQVWVGGLSPQQAGNLPAVDGERPPEKLVGLSWGDKRMGVGECRAKGLQEVSR